jgi:hypothetical protein
MLLSAIEVVNVEKDAEESQVISCTVDIIQLVYTCTAVGRTVVVDQQLSFR